MLRLLMAPLLVDLYLSAKVVPTVDVGFYADREKLFGDIGSFAHRSAAVCGSLRRSGQPRMRQTRRGRAPVVRLGRKMLGRGRVW